jgi:hypothetical protein
MALRMALNAVLASTVTSGTSSSSSVIASSLGLKPKAAISAASAAAASASSSACRCPPRRDNSLKLKTAWTLASNFALLCFHRINDFQVKPTLASNLMMMMTTMCGFHYESKEKQSMTTSDAVPVPVFQVCCDALAVIM